ncbi:AraC family transcriptional regulator [Paenibacillus selenitireducens]|uniref:AraC family transcriptional regulator n=1 Tax=Paenibacillus selenitireducens TaxID=1324314 RepID=A0A1T2X4G3_9BACL|nr:AraC family transcriptional regulator [Paenibacillus selenitireducens]OPA74788.1 AraC family transcriptional regulator [Paenibacillus selenitireducens]
MNSDYISPYIRRAMDNYIPPNWGIRERVIWDYELLYVMQGKLRITVEDIIYEGQCGDIFLFKPQQRHSIHVTGDKDARQPHIHFDLLEQPDSPHVDISFKPLSDMDERELQWFRPDHLSSPAFHLPSYIRLDNPRIFENMLFVIIKEFEQKLPLYQTRLKGLLIDLLVYLFREHNWNKTPQVMSNSNLLYRVQAYLNNQVHQEVRLDELSREFCISKFYLNRLFKSAYHVSPIQYHQNMRIEKAKEMVQFTDLPLEKIAELCGFTGIHTFSRAFKNKEGVPPSVYRKKKE